ncbi:phycobilisome rod-core linker polypeptide [Coleofasciculus sp. FACHB-712]|uniref:phycobilisome rod-core linker polypeptide n=1 Tax=Coleofasciculus sp. FACHB-712 TaxID=2692789 RepID=UPI0016868E12|nr:phycobilisome rod-core linker polypeptide [Coleofasciculus sp. FACHB-712]MBD1944444.1 phycobilisome rod-core linker polypeptide [Coleofasciculus sp. FACHB-712]
MPIPLLEITPTTQNQRVEGYEVPDEDDAQIYRLTDATSDTAINDLIWAAYRQIISEHLILESYRQPFLESQLRNRAISVREFIRGLGKSDVYRQLVADTNSNYRLVDITFKRFLGRATYGKDEQIAWSIVIASKGLHGFIDAVVDSEEYRQNFGDEIVPYQRRRFNERPFNLVNPRYSDYWRGRMMGLDTRSYFQVGGQNGTGKTSVRQAIPNNFLEMARSIAPSEVNYQRTRDRVLSQIKNMEIPDTRSKAANLQPAVGRTDVALPYRYLYPTPKA